MGDLSLKLVAWVLLESPARGVEEVVERPSCFISGFGGCWAKCAGAAGEITSSSEVLYFCSCPRDVAASGLIRSFLGTQVG